MEFEKALNSICPILSIGQKTAIECQKNCAWFHSDAQNCNLSIIADSVLHDPYITDIQRQNGLECKKD